MKVATEHWLKGLIAAMVTGISSSFLSAVGITGAQMVGIKIDSLSPKQLIVTTFMGGLVGGFAYLKQSPIPQEEQQDKPQ